MAAAAAAAAAAVAAPLPRVACVEPVCHARSNPSFRAARNFSALQQQLADVGIRHIRDGAYSGWHRVNELSTVDVLAIPEVSTPGRKLDFSQLQAQLSIAQNNITRLLALEGPNEYDRASAGAGGARSAMR